MAMECFNIVAITMILVSGSVGNGYSQPEQDTVKYEEEVRGVWITNVDSEVLHSQQNIAEAMDYLAANGFNVVFPVVWNKGYTQYPSDVMAQYFGESYRQDPFFSGQNRDPFRELIIEAHRNGMEVIPWFEYGFAYLYSGADSPPTGDSHIVEENPEWVARDAEGDILKKNGFEWLNAIHPEVQQFMLSLIKEVIQNYDVDGIQGDDRLPALPAEGGYSAYTDSLYKAEHDGKAPPESYSDDAFLQWKASKITQFGGSVHKRVKEADQNLTVSMAPSIFDFSYREYLQNWPAWLDSGYVDLVHPQAYRFSISSYKDVMHQMVGIKGAPSTGYLNQEYHDQVSPGILLKVGSRYNGPDYALEAVQINRDLGIDGEVYFFYEGLGAKNDYVGDSLGQKPYSDPAIMPNRNGNLRRPGGYIVNEDDEGAIKSGNWIAEDTPNGYEGRSLKIEGENATGASITYEFDIPHSAYYHVLIYIPDGQEASENVNYSIQGSRDSTEVRVDQSRKTNQGWLKLDDVYLEQGVQQVVTLHADSSNENNTIYADAAMLLLDRKKSPDVNIDVKLTDLEHAEGLQEKRTQPSKANIIGNYPNPFNPATTIRFRLYKPSVVSLDIYSVNGRKVASLINQQKFKAGTHRIKLNGKNLASGLYISRLTDAGGKVLDNRKMVLIK